VPVECWAFGTPILGTAANFITHGWDGIKAEGLHEVPRVINSLYENPCLYERLSKNGELRFKQEFSIKTMADSYYSVFKDVINKFEGYML
jgi:glycosyltransferase involved in cell wall biosynthesis